MTHVGRRPTSPPIVVGTTPTDLVTRVSPVSAFTQLDAHLISSTTLCLITLIEVGLQPTCHAPIAYLGRRSPAAPCAPGYDEVRLRRTGACLSGRMFVGAPRPCQHGGTGKRPLRPVARLSSVTAGPSMVTPGPFGVTGIGHRVGSAVRWRDRVVSWRHCAKMRQKAKFSRRGHGFSQIYRE